MVILQTKRIYCKTEACRKYANLNEEGYCPVCKPPQPQEQEDDKSVCTICEVNINEETDGVIGCDVCHKWFHPKCVGPPELDKLWDLFAKNSTSAEIIKGTLLWICPECSKKPDQCIKVTNQTCAKVSEKENPQEALTTNSTDQVKTQDPVVDLTPGNDQGTGKMQHSHNNNSFRPICN